MSEGVKYREKEFVETVVPCTLGKVCNWDTVDDSVQSHKSKKERRIHDLLLRQFLMSSVRQGSIAALESADSRNQVQLHP